MFTNTIKPYRFNILECFLLKRIEKLYLESGYSFYRWPEVYFGNFEDFPYLKIDDNEIELDNELYYLNLDYLGQYVYRGSKEGHIRIYKDRILRCARRITNNLNINEYQVVNDLLTIVLIHEIGHWFTHSCHVSNKRIRMQGFASQEKIITESLAQLTVVWSLMKLKNNEIERIKLIFQYLVDLQPYEYKAFKELGKKQTHVKTLLKRYGYIADDYIDKYGFDFEYFLQGDKIYKKNKFNY